MNKNLGVVAMGIKCPVIREGDDIVETVVRATLEATARDYDQMPVGGRAHELGGNLNYKNDVLLVTESVIARSAGLYVTVDEIAADVERIFGKDKTIAVLDPIYSRNRFSMILKGIARAANRILMRMPDYDEVGNPCGVNQFTGVDIEKYYKEICHSENCEFGTFSTISGWVDGAIYCGLHDYKEWKLRNTSISGDISVTLADICADKNPDFGLLGSNKATEEKLKLFPTVKLATKVCEEIKKKIRTATGKDVIVCCYGDGCFKSLAGEIWECADPTTMPGYTNPEIIESTPNEIKFKAFIDESKNDDELQENIEKATSEKNLVGKMSAMGTTPRLYRDLLASTADLISGSGNRQTPVVLLQNVFD